MTKLLIKRSSITVLDLTKKRASTPRKKNNIFVLFCFVLLFN